MKQFQNTKISKPICNYSLNYRPDIDGIRALAVISVFIYHLFPTILLGGFIGVDVFFVISGFLISSIIYKQVFEENFSFYKFYSRRIRRIYPVLLLVLIFVLSLGFFYFSPREYESLGKHSFGGSAFISNILLCKEVSYFDLSSTQKPLLHLWSLGVEEQFYIIWPIALLLTYKINKNLLLPLAIAIFFVSFVMNVALVKNHPTGVFFSPFTRFWELVAGSILAYVNVRHINQFKSLKRAINDKFKLNIFSSIFSINNLISYIGLILLIVSIVFVKKENFPGYFGVLSCVCMIAAGPSSLFNKYILSNRFIVFIGLISYPMYLWHWPFVSLYHILMAQEPTITYAVIIIPLVIVLSYLTTKFVEAPFRFGNNGLVKTFILVIAMTIVGGYGLNVWLKEGKVSSFNLNLYESSVDSAYLAVPSVNNSLKDDFNRCSLNSNFNSLKSNDYSVYCLLDEPQKNQKLVLIGDSHIAQYYLSLKSILTHTIGIDMYRASSSFPLIDIVTANQLRTKDYNAVNLFKMAYKSIIEDKTATTVILSHQVSSRLETDIIDLQNLDSKNWKINYQNGLIRTLDMLKKANKKVFFIIDTPQLNVMSNRFMVRNPPFNLSLPSEMNRLSYDNSFSSKEWQPIFKEIVSKYSNVVIIDVPNYLCDKKNCLTKIQGKPIYTPLENSINPHTTLDGADYISKQIFRSLVNSGVFNQSKADLEEN